MGYILLEVGNMKKITAGVYVENEISVCNSGLVVTPEGTVVIDTPMNPDSAKQWAKQAEDFGPVKYLINTEPHGDHTTGNCYFGGVLISHEGVRDAVLASKISDVQGMLRMRWPDAELPKDFRFRAPDITYNDKLKFYFGGLTFNLIHMPGHTPFQTVVYIPEKRIVFTSDNISRAIPFFHQAVPDVWLETLKEMDKLDVDYVVPGHGDTGGKNIIKEMYDNVGIWTETVKEAISAGKTVEETQQTTDMYKKLPNLPRDERSPGIVSMNLAAIYKYYKK
jgi:cyclase